MRLPRGPRRGFSVVEMAIVSVLLALLAMLLASTWRGFCLPTIEAAARCRIAQEANLAAASLARDLGGSLANPEGRIGKKTDGQFVGRMQPSESWLRLCFHGATGTDTSPQWGDPDTVISYQLQGDSLVRWDESAGTVVTVSRGLAGFSVVPFEDDSGVTLTLSYSYRNISLTYTFNAKDPKAP